MFYYVRILCHTLHHYKTLLHANRLQLFCKLEINLPKQNEKIPGVSALLGPSQPDWGYYTTNDDFSSQAQKLQKVHTTKGKMLGGSSSLNYMYYVRGNQRDYNDWVADGNPGWDWNTVLGYFKKSEHLTDDELAKGKSSYLHGSTGYLGVTRPVWDKETKQYFNAFKENGHDIVEDLNGVSQLGYSSPSYTISNYKRQSTALVYIRPVMKRQNLFLLKNTLATKIVLDGNKRATSVEFEEKGVKKYVFSRKEIIVSAGGINTPKLLMLSGIGPKDHLQDLGIEVQVNIPNIGSNLQDHIIIPLMLSNENGPSNVLDILKPLINLDKFPVPGIMGFAAVDKNQTFPDYQITAFPSPTGSSLPTLMCSKVFNWNDEVCYAVTNATDKEVLFTLMTLLKPKSRGTIRLKSKDPYSPPIINSGYFSNYDDSKKYADCIRDFTSVTSTEYSKRMKLEVVDLKIKECAHIAYDSHKYWECYALNLAASQYHYSGTCAMGPEGIGVVDERLRVRSVKGLRVVDTSVMPTIVSGNTFAPVVMIAEKASDMIKDDHGICDCYSKSC